MQETTYGWVIQHCGMTHVFECKDDMELFVRTFEVDVESDYAKPKRCEIHHFDIMNPANHTNSIFKSLDGIEVIPCAAE